MTQVHSIAEPSQMAKHGGALAGAVVLMGEALGSAAAAARAALRKEGAIEVIWRRSLQGVEAALADGGVDLLLVDLSHADGDAIGVAHRVRFGELGENPFLPLMITTWRADGEIITAALAAGADDVLAKPISASAVAKRAHRIAVSRKPFTVIGDYIGPTRAGMENSANAAYAFHPPNHLKALANGQSTRTPEALEEMEQAKRRLIALRVTNSLRDVSSAARKALAAAPKPLANPIDIVAMKTSGSRLQAIIPIMPPGGALEAIKRLTALIDIATNQRAAAVRATALSADIADAVLMLLMRQEHDDMGLPADIIASIDARFSALISKPQ